jgi:hypothetical protein
MAHQPHQLEFKEEILMKFLVISKQNCKIFNKISKINLIYNLIKFEYY